MRLFSRGRSGSASPTSSRFVAAAMLVVTAAPALADDSRSAFREHHGSRQDGARKMPQHDA